MNLQEFQAKELLARFGIVSPRGRVVASAREAERVARQLGFARFVVKAQVRAGERFASGGIAFAGTPHEAAGIAGQMIGAALVTPQTDRRGEPVRLVGIEEAIAARLLLYAAVVIDPGSGRLMLVASPHGGSEISDALLARPTETFRRAIPVGAIDEPGPYRAACEALRLEGQVADTVAEVLKRMATAAVRLDATLIEINPLAVTEEAQCIALDAKIAIDTNALFRQGELAKLREVEAEEVEQAAAIELDRRQINYVGLDGDIGLAVNGAGLALATLDLVVACGGRPANFMDIRTTASSQDIAAGFRQLLGRPDVRALLVNVHGGGMQRCDTIAEGLAVACRGADRAVPIVARFAGNNADFAVTRLRGAGVSFELARDMRDGAERAVRRGAGAAV